MDRDRIFEIQAFALLVERYENEIPELVKDVRDFFWNNVTARDIVMLAREARNNEISVSYLFQENARLRGEIARLELGGSHEAA